MKPYQFRVRLDREPTELEIEALGTVCNDAGLSHGNGTGELDFERDAPSFADAVFSAITDVEAATGLHATAVEADPLVSVLGVRPDLRHYRSPSSIRASRSKHTCAAATAVISAWS
jgi:hypothetical protein